MDTALERALQVQKDCSSMVHEAHAGWLQCVELSRNSEVLLHCYKVTPEDGGIKPGLVCNQRDMAVSLGLS